MELGHWVTGSSGSPGRWIPGSLGRWVTKCDPVPRLVVTRTESNLGLPVAVLVTSQFHDDVRGGGGGTAPRVSSRNRTLG